MPGRTSSRRAFTLLELLVVLLVLSLCAATTIRWYFSNAEITLENAAILLARDLRAAQHRSIFLGEPSQLMFLSDGTGYALTDGAGSIARHPQTDEPFLRVYSEDGVFSGVHVAEARAGQDRTLQIDDRGLPLEDLRVTITFEDERRTVVFERESGKVWIEGSSSGWTE